MITELPALPSGNAKETAWFRQLARCLRERTVKVGTGMRVSYKGDHTLVELVPEAAPPPSEDSGTIEVKRCSILAVHPEWVQVQSGSDVLQVARPRELRVNFPFVPNNQQGDTGLNSRNVAVTPGLIQETIDPPYTVDEFGISELYAVRLPEQKTAVQVDGAFLEWMDLNVEARHWRPGYRWIQFRDAANTVRTIIVAGQEQF